LQTAALAGVCRADPPQGGAQPAPAGESVSAEPLTSLVASLGSESFEQRQAAEAKLRAVGVAARAALETGLADDDLQVRRTCRRLLNDILELDYHSRLQRFLGDTEGKLEHDLPGWRRFREIAGEGQQARTLFGEMHREEGPLLISAESGDVPAAESLDLRLRSTIQLMQHRQANFRVQPSPGAVAALFFVAGDAGLNLPPALADSGYWSQLASSINFRGALTGGDASVPLRRILGQWVLRPGEGMLNQKLRLATQYSLEEGLQKALEVIESGDKIAPLNTSYAVEAVGRLGGVDQAARLAPLLEDAREVVPQRVNQPIVAVEVRDVALGWLVHVTQQDHAAYHLPRAKTAFVRLKASPTYPISYSYMRFDAKEKREEALAKWKAWAAEHPLAK
jgi:hypothetical protein